MARIKVCGITRLEDARFCTDAGVHYLGFVQDPSSERHVTPALVAQIIEEVHVPEPVGVFCNVDAATINEACSEAGFTLAQLDGHEDLDTIDALDVPVIKTIRVQHDASSEQILAMMERYVGRVAFFLLETSRTSLWGGEGESFNWRVAREIGRDFPLFVSGAITPDNAVSAIETMNPFAVNVSETLESAPGVKDHDLVRGLIEAVRTADQ